MDSCFGGSIHRLHREGMLQVLLNSKEGFQMDRITENERAIAEAALNLHNG